MIIRYNQTNDTPKNNATAETWFDGTGGEFFLLWISNFLLIQLTLGIYIPFAYVRVKKWKINNTCIEGERFMFIGKGAALLPRLLGWGLLCILTFGIYFFWARTNLLEWVAENTIKIPKKKQ